MHDFDYVAPTTLDEAIAALAKHDGQARCLAGGTDLIDQMRTGRRRPALVVDVKKIPELNALVVSDDGLRLGAAVPCSDVYRNEGVAQDYAALADAARIIGGIQIQNRASIGGNVCNSSPAADSVPALIALQAVCVIAGPNGPREVPIERFFTGPGGNVLEAGELLVELRMPPRPPRSGSHYRRFIPRNEMDIAVVGVGASVQLEDDGRTVAAARIGLGAVAPTPLLAEEAARVLVGRSVDDEAALSDAAEAARAVIRPIDDMRGTKAFRSHVTGVLVQRVVRAAAARARGESLDYCPGH
ncbi:MAG: xanthine dehydrogenase family protein subunit M [Planctomycetota bacterium]|nr:MAG: xanthine dehydrogenase family protein subunit M [Planctomycetota bacterium]